MGALHSVDGVGFVPSTDYPLPYEKSGHTGDY